jgi:TolB protein
MKKTLAFTIVIFIMVFNLCCGLGVKPANAELALFSNEFQLNLNNSSQQNPDIYEYALNSWAVVWQDNRNGNWDIYMYSQKKLEDGKYETLWDVRITENGGINVSPKIFGDIIVYQSKRGDNWDIYMYNLTSKVETQITDNPADQQFPEVYGDIIVWEDYRNAYGNYLTLGLDVYMYNLTSKSEQILPVPEANAYGPVIYGDRVVYAAENYTVFSSTFTDVYPFVCYYDLSTGVKTVVVAGNQGLHSSPGINLDDKFIESVDVGGDLVAWDWRHLVIFVKNVSSGSVWQTDIGYYMNPVVGGGRFVGYQINVGNYWYLDVYDSYYERNDRLTDALGHQINPAMSQTNCNFMVFQDGRSGIWHIYVAGFWYSVMGGGSTPDPPITPSQVISNLHETKSRIVDTPMSGFSGANNKVKENRKNVMINKLDSGIANVEAAVNTQNLNVRRTYLQRTINQLNSLIDKVDGWTLREAADIPGYGFTPDWITAPIFLDQMIRSCQNDLQTLLNGII